MKQTAEHQRLDSDQLAQWRRWGCYLGDRAWGTIRESAPTSADPWATFPWEQAQQRVFRWTEDGIAGWCDMQQQICHSIAFWNEEDDRLKERFFGLSNQEGNHGEDVKEYYWYSEALPSGAYYRMRYLYPQVAFPYERLRQENTLRSQSEPGFCLIDALPQTFREQRFFDLTIEYAKPAPDVMLCRISAVNRGPDPAPLHIVPKLWLPFNPEIAQARISQHADQVIVLQHPNVEQYRWWLDDAATVYFNDYQSNTHALYDQAKPASAKDAIQRFIVQGKPDLLNAERNGTQASAHYQRILEPGETWSITLGFGPSSAANPLMNADECLRQRRAEADEFYASISHSSQQSDLQLVQRAAFAGLNWNKLAYRFEVEEWLASGEGDHGAMPDHPDKEWGHLQANDLVSIPDRWEFPILATWDLDVQIVTLGLVDPAFAKAQALLLLNERYQHPNGAIPATEGAWANPHPPIHGWAIWQIYHLCDQDQAFLAAAYPSLKRHFSWWTREHRHADGLFTGCFMGMDNISLIDRQKLPKGYRLVQADTTGWLAQYALMLLKMAIVLGNDADACHFLDEFLAIRKALNTLWDSKDRFFYDALVNEDDTYISLKVRSLVGLVPLLATTVIDLTSLSEVPHVAARLKKLNQAADQSEQLLLTAVGQHWKPLINALFDEAEFLSPYGIRSVSLVHAEHPAALTLEQEQYEVVYEPGEAPDRMFGGNSNWRGPIWLPLNQLLLEAVHNLQSGVQQQAWHSEAFANLTEARDSLIQRLVGIFVANEQGQRPYLGNQALFQQESIWHEHPWFHEYFHAETGKGLGASHQHGWTASIAAIIHCAGLWNVALKSASTA
ncbi:MGH1-like glycoside hydrolase domain-containing protein [Herpetosiphon llansteffanensis]